MDVAKKKKRNKGWPASPRFSGQALPDRATMNRIMLRFRPIAPKPPTTDGSASDSTKTTTAGTALLAKRRPKRKYVRVNKNKNNTSGSGSTRASRRKCKKTIDEDTGKGLRFDVDGDGIFSLQTAAPGDTLPPEDIGSGTKIMMSFGLPSNDNDNDNLGLSLRLGLGEWTDRVVESWVVVTGVTETAVVDVVGGGLLGSTDGEKMRNLEADTCPGLISDGLHRVQWMNLAYKRMVDPGRDEGGGGQPAEVVVRLVLKDNIPVGWAAFACTVRVVYTWRKEKYSKTMPCDVWKMEFGGFAWRLDAKAALCLGR